MRSLFNVDKLSDLSSRYVTNRDNFRARYQARQSGLIALSDGGPLAFDGLIGQHVEELTRIMPTDLTLAQWEGLAELFNAKLNNLRMRMTEDAAKVTL